jgi:trans-2,3-dihydro-3-hydroxyanthranilic acid synthase
VSIPRIAGYPMPVRAQLTPAAAGWRPDPGRAALLIHDMQRYFVGFFPPGEAPTTALIANIARVRRAAMSHGMPVIYSVQPGRMSRAERGLLLDIWGPGMTDDEDSRAVVPELTPAAGDLVVTKHRYSAFHRTGLAAALASMGRDQLIVCGVFAHIGCLFTAGDAFSHDIQPFLLADAVADFSLRDHLMALDYAARRCAVTMTTAELLASLPARPRTAGSAMPVPPVRRSRASGRSAGGGS